MSNILNSYELIQDNIDDKNIDKMLDNTYKSISEDDRPQIGLSNQDFGKLINKNENEKTKLSIRKEETEQIENKKTILDMPIKDILGKTSEVTSNFWDDYKIKISEIEINEKLRDKNYKNSFINIIKIHILALVEYMKYNDNGLYIGILIVIISIILYMFNITSK